MGEESGRKKSMSQRRSERGPGIQECGVTRPTIGPAHVSVDASALE